MNRLSSLLDLYYNDLYNDLEIFEKERKKLASRLKTIAISIFFIDTILIYFIYKNSQDLENIIFVIAASVSIYFFIQKIVTKKYRENFKEKIIKKLILHLDKNLKYSPNSYFPQNLYILSSLFPKKFDRYNGNDLVVGQIQNIPVIFSDIHTQYKTKDSKGRTHWHTIFKGLFFMADFNKDFYGKTLIFPDTAQKLFGYLGQFLQEIFKKQGLELVKLDHPQFEKEFVVYSSDQIEARYILTTNLMEKLVRMKKKLNKPIYISFVNNHIFVAISDIDSFEPSIFSSLFDISLIKNYIITLKYTVGLVEELNLNKKLWSRL
ncbi:DUF3137 domain-containing protein [Nitrosophilus kaiyonis]|uniref:DUF3137 domain-containing protein n=1 Tax=Nitrosophilus kaiyonis TaxID=2930200 RepID=UPI00248F804C|nr:DUF3137 domain-containing protein [Nitrosophilus kaiyonis]